jgi:hypothetical protein
MAGERIDAGTLLADVQAKIKALRDLESALITAQAVGAFGLGGESIDISPALITNGETGIPSELPRGAFLGKSLPVCVKMHLSAVHKKQSIKEISNALRAGGVESTSDNFENVVNAALQRLKSAGEVLRFNDGFGLAEWYHPSLRASASPPVKKNKAKPRRSVKRKAAKGKATEAAATPVTEPLKVEPQNTEKESGEKQILAYFRQHHGRDISKSDLVAAGVRSQTAALVLGKLVHRNVLTKTESGAYRMTA